MTKLHDIETLLARIDERTARIDQRQRAHGLTLDRLDREAGVQQEAVRGARSHIAKLWTFVLLGLGGMASLGIMVWRLYERIEAYLQQ